MREASYSTLRLGLYEPIKRNLGEGDAIWKKFAAGALSGMIGSAIANPADLLKTRAQAQAPGEYKTLSWFVKDIYRNGGISGFYVGVTPTVVRATLLNGTKLGTYDTVKHTIIDNGWIEEGKKCQFATAVIASFCMTVVTSPMDNIKTRVMNMPAGESMSIIACGRMMLG